MKYIPLDNFDLYNLVAPTCHDSISHLNYVAAWNPLAAELVYLSCLINSQNTRKLNANKYARSEMDVVYDPCVRSCTLILLILLLSWRTIYHFI